MLLFNAHHEPVQFKLPTIPAGRRWELLVDTAEALTTRKMYRTGQRYEVAGRAVAVLRLTTP